MNTRGLMIAAISAVSFGLSGPLAKSLIDAGWSSTAASSLRLGLGALMLVVPILVLRPRRLLAIAKAPARVLAYGVFAVAAAQLCFFNAVRYLDVPVALLIEYSAPLLVIVYVWAVRHRRPSGLTLIGAAVAVLGLLVVIGGGGAGLSIDPVGVAWALGAAVGLAGYFILADQSGDDESIVDPLALTCGGLLVGTVLVTGAGAVGLFPMHATTAEVTLADQQMPWWIAAFAVAGIATALAYLTGITAVRMLGATLASFVALLEVLASAVASWILLGQVMGWIQVIGAIVLVAGIVSVRTGSRPESATATVTVDPSIAQTERMQSGVVQSTIRRSDEPQPEPIAPTGNLLPPTVS